MGKADSGARPKTRRTGEFLLVAFFAVAIAVLVGVALAADPNDPGLSGESDIRAALDPLHYSYTLDPVEVPNTSAAYIGHARDSSGDIADFGISICAGSRLSECRTPLLGKRKVSGSGAGNANYWVKVEGGLAPAVRSRRLEMWAAIDSAFCHAAASREYECSG
jgi:hypothetical protein